MAHLCPGSAMKILVFCIALFAALLAIPEHAYAWGPGAHLAIGQTVLENLGLLPALLAEMISRNTSAFLYGSLSADIFIGKGTRIKPGHSHNWETGFKLLDTAKDSGTRAYAYGYLTHLAADVVAHNFYVPNMVWNMPYGGKASHVYVEMQADMKINWSPKLALSLFRNPSEKEEGALLTATDQRRWTFMIKKRLMMGSLNLCARKSWDNSLDLAERMLPWPHNTGYLEEMLELSTRTVFHFLCDSSLSPALAHDPIGSRNLARVRGLRASRMSRSRQNTILFKTPLPLTEQAYLPLTQGGMDNAQAL